MRRPILTSVFVAANGLMIFSNLYYGTPPPLWVNVVYCSVLAAFTADVLIISRYRRPGPPPA